MEHPALTIRTVRSRAVGVPMRRPLGTSAARMTLAPFVLVDLETEQGITGRAHAFCYMDMAAPMIRQCLQAASDGIAGPPLDPQEIGRLCRGRFTLVGTSGIVGMALSALDVACWDALSRARGIPLSHYLGGRAEPVPAYNSNGLGMTEPDGLGDEANALLSEGFDAVKIRLGRHDAQEDLRAVRSVRSAVPADTILMADYNQALSVDDAIDRGEALKDEGLYWIEEPVAHDDFAGSARIAEALETPIQIGENFCGPQVMESAIAMKAMDFVMPDLMRIGGISGWLRAADLAEGAGLPLSSHLYPEVSAHLLSATPTAHWLEYVDWAEPILTNGIVVKNGEAYVPDTPGTGVDWDKDAVRHYTID
jgi:mandelate racemase